MKKEKLDKTLLWTEHGFVVRTELPPFTSGLPRNNCPHISHMKEEEIETVQEMIEKIENIRQPIWNKSFKLGRYFFSMTKY